MPREACWPCRERKLKCNASTVGVPCTRCRTLDKVSDCFVPARQKRQIRKAFTRSRTRHGVTLQPNASTTTSGVRHSETNGAQEPSDCTASQGIYALSIPGESSISVITDEHVVLPAPHGKKNAHDNPLGREETLHSEEDDDDILARVCQKIASGGADAVQTASARTWTESIEYQNSFNATGILGEVLARRGLFNRLIKINYNSSTQNELVTRTRRDVELIGLDESEKAFLTSKGVFELPSKSLCLEFLNTYFRFAFPYAPVLDRGDLLTSFEKQEHSTFLMQAILANVVPYCSRDLIQRSGFQDHASAQKTFYKRAVILYDFNCEKSRLVLLQGSLLLGTQWLSYFNDKDYQFWMCNAIRIAARMGIHRRHIEADLDARFDKLLKRIWWTISIRDVLSTISGLDNGRPALPRQCDTDKLVEDDWPEDICPEHLRPHLPVTQTYHKQFFMHLAELSLIGSDAHTAILSRSALELDRQRVTEIIDNIHSWKVKLPSKLRPESVKEWDEEGLWILVLMAWCYRMECNIYRALRKANDLVSDDFVDSTRRLQTAIFELDIIVKRAVTHNVGKLLPMSFSTAVATLIALSIEVLLRTELSASDRFMCEDAVRTGMLFLTDSSETWSCLRWMLRMFHWALSQSKLDHLIDRLNDYPRLHENDQNMQLDETLRFDPSIPFEWTDSGSMLWESAFLTNSGIPDWQEWLDF